MAEFRKTFSEARHIAIITGAGVSAESGVPTFRGENEKWRKWLSQVVTFFMFLSLHLGATCAWSQLQVWLRIVAVEWVYYLFT